MSNIVDIRGKRFEHKTVASTEQEFTYGPEECQEAWYWLKDIADKNKYAGKVGRAAAVLCLELVKLNNLAHEQQRTIAQLEARTKITPQKIVIENPIELSQVSDAAADDGGVQTP